VSFCLVALFGGRGTGGGWVDPSPFRFLCDPRNGFFGVKAVVLSEYLDEGPGRPFCRSCSDLHV